MPSITNTLKDTGVAEISLDETDEGKVTSTEAFDESNADITIHKVPKETSEKQ